MNIDRFQNVIAAWRFTKFGPHVANGHQPLIGIMEELGELSHAHLKGEQGIKHSPEEIIRLKVDAIGDILVFLCGYCDSQNLLLSDCAEVAWKEIKDREYKKIAEQEKS